jgi:hypothetical protein
VENGTGRRHQLRCWGRGGAILVSLALTAQGSRALEDVLRAVATCAPDNPDASSGTVDTEYGCVRWWFTEIEHPDHSSRLALNVAIASEIDLDANQ